jgi:hypothetical protein
MYTTAPRSNTSFGSSRGVIVSLVFEVGFCNLQQIWPEDRMLELAPLFWVRTRARLDAAELEREIGWIAIPKVPLDTSATSEEQPSTR